MHFFLRLRRAAIVLSLGLACLGSTPQSALGEVIFGNLSETTNVGAIFSSDSWQYAQQFQTTSTGYILESVTVRLENTGSSATGSYSLSVYASATDNPGSLLGLVGTGSWANIGSSYENKTINGSLTLSPNSTYFMVMSVAGTTGLWGMTSTDPGFVARESANTGTTWTTSSFFPQMQVTAVPEPSNYAIAMAGVATLLLRRRRRRGC